MSLSLPFPPAGTTREAGSRGFSLRSDDRGASWPGYTEPLVQEAGGIVPEMLVRGWCRGYRWLQARPVAASAFIHNISDSMRQFAKCLEAWSTGILQAHEIPLPGPGSEEPGAPRAMPSVDGCSTGLFRGGRRGLGGRAGTCRQQISQAQGEE